MRLALLHLVPWAVLSLGFSLPIAAQSTQQERPARKLAAPTRIPGEPFSSIRGAVALRNGRLVVSDTREQRVVMLDPATGAMNQIGRVGGGPGEYRQPGGVYRASGGGARVYDPAQQRYLEIRPDGAVGAVTAVPNPSSSFNFSDAGPDQWVPDTLGNVYSVQRNLLRDGQADSVALVRTDPAGRADTMTWLRLQESKPIQAGEGIRMSLLVHFSPADAWAVAPDGWVAVVRAAPYRVDWFPPRGAAVRGASVAFSALPVTDRDKAIVRERMGQGGPIGNIAISRPGSGTRNQAVRPHSVEPEFKTTKPPFPVHLPRIDAQGRLWVERSARAGETDRTFDVFDRRGALVDRVTLVNGARLVGFDADGRPLAAEADEDDLLTLVRYELR